MPRPTRDPRIAPESRPGGPSRRRFLGAAGAGLGAAGLGASGLLRGAPPAAAAPASRWTVPAPVRGWPEGFRFGAAGSGFQVEGSNPDSNWRRYVRRESAAGKVDPVRDSVDFFHRYREDVKLAAGMGLNAFRLGIEWARVEPQRGRIDQAALAFYDDVIDTVVAHGMTPMITMVHYVYPGWLADRGGFVNPAALGDFERFARLITRRYADRCSMWITFNEPLVFVNHELEIGELDPADSATFLDNIVRAHRIAYRLAHQANPRARVALNEAFLPAVTPITDGLFLDRVTEYLDFIGIDYYYTASLDNLTAAYAGMGDFPSVRPQPDGLYQALHHYHRRYPGRPLYVVENGMPTDNGRPRADGYTRGEFIEDSLFWVQRARGEGIPVVGYNHWSITDNYEWGSYDSRFGLYRVDVLTDPALTRRPTSGVAAYRRAAASGGPRLSYRPAIAPAVGDLSRIPESVLTRADVNGPRARLV